MWGFGVQALGSGCGGLCLGLNRRNLIKKPWVYNPKMVGFI